MKNRPNILLVTTDQQRWDAAGGTGPSYLRTPHFNNLCREGVRFNRAYSDCPLCMPARRTLMTGQYAYTHGLTDNLPTPKLENIAETLPGRLTSAGYQTMAVGKMHFTPQRFRQGFQEMILPDDYYREMARKGGIQPMRHGLGQNEHTPTMATVPETETLTSWIAERSADFISHRRDPESPFFMWTSFSKPHPPFDPPEPYYSMYRHCDIPEPIFGDWSGEDCPVAMWRYWDRLGTRQLTPEITREARAAYYGLISQIDFNMGRIFAALRETDQWKNTIILYTSDHGEFLGDHHAVQKSFFHESAGRVPFVLRLPPAEPWVTSDRTVEDLVCLADVYPTLLSAAGVEIPPHVDGENLLPIVQGEKGKPNRRVVSVYATDKERCYQLAVTDGRWKYFWFPEGPSEQLFDLQADAQELHNLAGTHAVAEIQADLHQTIVDRLTEKKSPYVEDGKLWSYPVVEDPPGYNGARVFPAYAMEDADRDARH